MTVEGQNHETTTESHCEMVGHVSMATCGQQQCFLLVNGEAVNNIRTASTK
jgi:hypothetical protein